jgi:hypothetical protein
MTIAMCYLSPEGVVLGADSTASISIPGGGFHYFNHAQKLFEIGCNGTLGILVWGMGGLPISSHRSLVALLAADLAQNPAGDVQSVAQRWIDQFWTVYTTELAASIARIHALNGKAAFDPTAPDPAARSEAEEREFQQLRMGLGVGFCIGGYVPPSRTPAAYVMGFDPLSAKPSPTALPMHSGGFWGAPNMIQRLINGSDPNLKSDLMGSGKWSGSEAELDTMFGKHALAHPVLPLRDAVDFVHACIYSTIKAFKFSNLSQICGGPIELAVISSDRNFRWVHHKPWDAAISEGAIE